MEPPTADERIEIVDFYLDDGASRSVKTFSAFLAFYKRVTTAQAFRAAAYQVDEPIIESHEHLQRLVQQLRNNPGVTREQFQGQVFQRQGISDQESLYAIKVIVKLGFGLSAAPQWEPQQSFSDFVTKCLPKQKPIDEDDPEPFSTIYAWKLQKRCAIEFERTDDPSEHLQYDRKNKRLKIFHQMAALRMQLQRHSQPVQDLSIEESLKMGTLPPQLMLEVLESFYELLFPVVFDKKGRSKRLLRRLVKKNGFDPQVFTGSHSRWRPDDFEYVYLGPRLKELEELVRKPPPSTNWMSWMERHTSERNALMIAIVGLFLAALFGLIGCILAAAQLWIAVLAWKQPVTS